MASHHVCFWGAVTAAALAGALPAWAAPDRGYPVGTLKCRFTGSDAAIHFGANRNLSCIFHHRRGRRNERYYGNVRKYGIEIGIIGKRWLSWKVTSTRKRRLRRGALSGSYHGVTAEASVGTGFAANVLTGGPRKNISLTPLAFQRQEGLNVAAGLMILTLKRRR